MEFGPSHTSNVVGMTVKLHGVNSSAVCHSNHIFKSVIYPKSHSKLLHVSTVYLVKQYSIDPAFSALEQDYALQENIEVQSLHSWLPCSYWQTTLVCKENRRML